MSLEPHPNRVEVLVVGGGHAGLSLSYLLKQQGISHLVLEKNRLGHAWRSERWDSFCLVTPNWQCNLPGFAYQGGDPDGFMARDDIVAWLDAYVAWFNPPALQGVAVTGVRRDAAGGWLVQSSAGQYHAAQVVIAAGGYHTPIIPADAARLPDSMMQLHSSGYVNPAQLPPGAVLVVGTGQSGCQIAEDLHLAGRRVHLCVGGAPRVARRYRGKDVVRWLDEMTRDELPGQRQATGAGVRNQTNPYVTGRDGGRDIDLRQFALEGMRLYGRYLGLEDGMARCGGDLARNLDGADAAYCKMNVSIDQYIADHGIDAPAGAPYAPVWHPPPDAPTSLDLTDGAIAAVIWCIGFRPDFSWVDAASVDERGSAVHERGVTVEPGLYFLGLPWEGSRRSGRFAGIEADAGHLLEHIVRHARQAAGGTSCQGVAPA